MSKFKVGDRVNFSYGDSVYEGVIVENVDEVGKVWHYIEFTIDGRTGSRWVSKPYVLGLIQAAPKKTLNFWEAREATLAGKTVKRLIAEDEFCNYYSKDFLTRSMAPCEVNGHWEIVEQPKQRK
jgi:hypothetical protein